MIFAGAGVLLSVAIILDLTRSDCSDTELTQAAKDVSASQDAIVDIFERIENFFRRLEAYTEVPTTEGMKYIIIKIMVEVLGIFAIVTKEMKQGRASESTPDSTSPVADRSSEKYLKKLLGRKDIEDALSRLDKLTQEEARMATAQVLKVAHDVKEEVKTVGEEVKDVGDKVQGVGDKVKDVDDKVNVVIEGAFSTLATHDAITNSYTTRWQGSQSGDNGNESSVATDGRQYRRR